MIVLEMELLSSEIIPDAEKERSPPMTDTSTTPTTATGAPATDQITLYGAGWCGDTVRSQALLDRLGIDYLYVDVDADPTASAWAAGQNGGQRRIPVISLGRGGPILIEPTDPELSDAVRQRSES